MAVYAVQIEERKSNIELLNEIAIDADDKENKDSQKANYGYDNANQTKCIFVSCLFGL